jgi:hypothetical protein
MQELTDNMPLGCMVAWLDTLSERGRACMKTSLPFINFYSCILAYNQNERTG